MLLSNILLIFGNSCSYWAFLMSQYLETEHFIQTDWPLFSLKCNQIDHAWNVLGSLCRGWNGCFRKNSVQFHKSFDQYFDKFYEISIWGLYFCQTWPYIKICRKTGEIIFSQFLSFLKSDFKFTILRLTNMVIYI